MTIYDIDPARAEKLQFAIVNRNFVHYPIVRPPKLTLPWRPLRSGKRLICRLHPDPKTEQSLVILTLPASFAERRPDKEISRWSYEDLQQAVQRATKAKGDVLFDVANAAGEDLDEAGFVDSVSRNLARGRFLLLVVGDGIREGVENIANFLQAHSGLNFTFALVELAVFRTPEDLSQGLIVEPRVLARTVEVERAVVRIEGGEISVEEPVDQVVTHKKLGQRVKITEEEFYEGLKEADPEVVKPLKNFLSHVEDRGLVVSHGGASMIIHWVDDDLGKVNFGTFFKDGTFHTNYLCYTADKAGDLSIGLDYLKTIADLIGNATVLDKGRHWTWCVKRHGKRPPIKDILKHSDQWLDLIDGTIQRFNELKG
jgi:hypothetical protein